MRNIIYIRMYPFRQFVNLQPYWILLLSGVREAFDRWEMCSATVQKFMGFALTSLSQKANNNSDNVKTVVSPCPRATGIRNFQHVL